MSAFVQGCASTYSTGQLTLYGRREENDGTSPIILYGHGGAGTALELTTYDVATYPQFLAEAGFIVVCGDWGGPAWGNPGAITAMEATVTQLQADGAKAGPVGLWGVSMGFMTVCNYWNDHEADVLAVMGVVPVVQATNVYNDNAFLQADMDAAYSGDFLANGASRSPHLLGLDVDLCLMYYSSADTVIRAADVLAFDPSATNLEPSIPSGHGAYLSSSINQNTIVNHFSVLLA